jgi:hypothetical protein
MYMQTSQLRIEVWISSMVKLSELLSLSLILLPLAVESLESKEKLGMEVMNLLILNSKFIYSISSSFLLIL